MELLTNSHILHWRRRGHALEDPAILAATAAIHVAQVVEVAIGVEVAGVGGGLREVVTDHGVLVRLLGPLGHILWRTDALVGVAFDAAVQELVLQVHVLRTVVVLQRGLVLAAVQANDGVRFIAIQLAIIVVVIAAVIIVVVIGNIAGAVVVNVALVV